MNVQTIIVAAAMTWTQRPRFVWKGQLIRPIRTAGWLGSRVVSVLDSDAVQIAAATLSGNSLRQTAHTHRASVHQAAKLVAAILRVARVTAGLSENNGSLPPGL